MTFHSLAVHDHIDTFMWVFGILLILAALLALTLLIDVWLEEDQPDEGGPWG